MREALFEIAKEIRSAAATRGADEERTEASRHQAGRTRSSRSPWDDSEKDEHDAYVPSVGRLYAGPVAYGVPVNGALAAAGGVTVAAHLHPDDTRTLVLGIRGAFLWDASGSLTQVGADFGARILAYGKNNVGVGFVALITPGVAVLSAGGLTVGAFHFGGLAGPYFDFGAFSFQPLLGGAILAQKGSVGVFESAFDLGFRF